LAVKPLLSLGECGAYISVSILGRAGLLCLETLKYT